jgi:hypothetical protein
MAQEERFRRPLGGSTNVWRRDLLDHLAFLVMYNAKSPPSEEEVRDELRREFSPFLDDPAAVRARN